MTTMVLTGTEKQIKYATDLRERLLKKIDHSILEVQEVIDFEKECKASDAEIIKRLSQKTFTDLSFKIAFSFAQKEIPAFATPEKYIELLTIGKKHLLSLTSAKTIIDITTPETVTVYLSNVIKKMKFNG